MNASQNEFTWKQRGAIDYICGVSPGMCDAQTFEDRQAWEEGYHEQRDREEQVVLRVASKALGAMREAVRR